MAPDLKPVETDPVQIEQVIMNLVVNAHDAMPTGGKLVMETANVVLDDDYFRDHGEEGKAGEFVLLAVSDTGVGMDKKTQERIFEPFFTTKELGHGTGLGLATVYGIVKQAGGFIWVYSEPGQGSTFKVYLPVAPESAEEAVEEKPPAPAAMAKGNEVILLVEDDEMIRRLTRHILQRHGYLVLEAATGPQACQVAKEHPGKIHLLLTEVVLPQIGGREVAETVRKLHPDIKVLFMSGYTDDVIARRGVMELKMDIIQKPFTPIACWKQCGGRCEANSRACPAEPGVT